MSEARARLLQELLHFRRPIADVARDLSVFGWDSEQALVRLQTVHVVDVLTRFLSGEIGREDVEDWANAIECREDVDIVPDSQAANALNELANPVQSRPLTKQSAVEWIAALSS